MNEKAPTLSFQCPKLWQDMPGSETERFCEECGHSVQNLSLLSEEARRDLLQRAGTGRICGTYFQDLDGNLITADSEESLAAKVRALRLAAIASGAVALSACAGSSGEPTDLHFDTVGIICAPENGEK